MENKFYIDDFERFLKDKVDDFKMYPSRRVWHSIYNNMHPGSRWPSISMCITLICTLFLIGYLNTGTTKRSASQVAQNNKEIKNAGAPTLMATTANRQNLISLDDIAGRKNAAASKIDASVKLPYSNTAEQSTVNTSLLNSVNKNNSIGENKNLADNSMIGSVKNIVATSSAVTDAAVINHTFYTSQLEVEASQASQQTDGIMSATIVNDIQPSAVLQKNIVQPLSFSRSLVNADSYQGLDIAALNNISSSLENTYQSAANSQLSALDRSWIESYAMYNRPAPKKWKGKLSMQLYFTPSVVYRSLTTAVGKNASALFNTTASSNDVETFVTHKPSFGLETGTALVYDLFKNIKIKSGVQLNYTRYNVHAFNNFHPALTSLTMNSETGLSYEAYRSSNYSNYYGVDAVKLHSQTYQLSIPLGVDLRLAAIDNIEWYAGATVQPTFVFGGKSYLLSSDTRSYVPSSEFINHFNLNTGFETFLSIKTKSGYTWNIGPQFRKQIFSTNNKIYSVQERLVNYGIKVGISKKL